MTLLEPTRRQVLEYCAHDPVERVFLEDAARRGFGRFAAVANGEGAITALTEVDLTLEPGEVLGLVGENGAGKSTLVKIACGLVRPTAGRAEICGFPAGSRPATTSATS